jgi:hypothetical protein
MWVLTFDFPFVRACVSADDSTYSDQCGLMGQIGLLSTLMVSDECVQYSTERICSLFAFQTQHYQTKGCDAPAPQLCRDTCLVRCLHARVNVLT